MIDERVRQAIEGALAANDIARAAALADTAMTNGWRDPMLLNLVAWQREEAGDFAAAAALLDEAAILAPDDPLIEVAKGSLLRKQGRLADAILAFDTVLARVPALDAAWLERGYALDALGEPASATESYRRALAIDPDCAPAWSRLATAAARRGDRAATRDLAARALAIDPTDPAAWCAMIASDIDAGDAERTVAPLHRLLARSDLPPEDRMVALTLLGDAFDRLDAVDDAYRAYAAANRLFDDFHAPRVRRTGGEPSHLPFVERIDAEFMATEAGLWSAAHGAADGSRSPAFLLGYPRSGTTLTENILASLAGVSAIEERPTLAEADRSFLLQPHGMARLGAIDQGEATRYRHAYWRAAVKAGAAPGAALLVDMDPLKGLRLPIIAKLFPDARVMIMRRDPRDVIWSCFRRGFRVTAAAFEFTSLARTARHFAAMMRFTDHCLERLPLAVHDVRYGDLVTRFDDSTQALCSFLGLRWTSELRHFDRTARGRQVRTMSAAQVRRGLYDGQGQWRRYARYIEPVLPLIEPWVARYG